MVWICYLSSIDRSHLFWTFQLLIPANVSFIIFCMLVFYQLSLWKLIKKTETFQALCCSSLFSSSSWLPTFPSFYNILSFPEIYQTLWILLTISGILSASYFSLHVNIYIFLPNKNCPFQTIYHLTRIKSSENYLLLFHCKEVFLQ